MTYQCECTECDLKDVFYQSLGNEIALLMCERKVETFYHAGEKIIGEDDEITKFLYLKSGLVKLQRRVSDNEDQIITFGKPLDFVSLLSVFSGGTYNYSVYAIEESVTCSIDINIVFEQLRASGDFSTNLLKKMSKATDQLIIESLEIKKKNTPGKLAHFLLLFSDKFYLKDNFTLQITRKEIAEYLGSSTENVIRTLSDFKKSGLIKIFGKDIEIVDKKKIRQLAKFG